MNFAEDTGRTNEIICAYDPPLVAYTPGLVLRVRVRVTNTANVRIDAGPGWREIVKPDGMPITAGEMPAGMVANLVFDGTRFQLMNGAVAAAGGPDITIIESPIPFVRDTSPTPNRIDANFNPPITTAQLKPGLAILVQINNDNSAETIINVNDNHNIPVYANGHGPLYSYDIARDDVKLLVYDGARFWLDPNLLIRKFGAVSGWVRDDAVIGPDTDGTENNPFRAFRTIQQAYTAIGARYAPSPLLTIDIRLGRWGDYEGCSLGPYAGSVSITGETNGDLNSARNYRIWPHNEPSVGLAFGCVIAHSVSALVLNGVCLYGNRASPDWGSLRLGSTNCQTQNCYFDQVVSNAGNGSFVRIEMGSTYSMLPTTLTQEGNTIFNGNGQTMHSGLRCLVNGFYSGTNGNWARTVQYWYNTYFSVGGVSLRDLSTMEFGNTVVSQAGCTGRRWDVTTNSILRAIGQTLPGNANGTTAQGGLFV